MRKKRLFAKVFSTKFRGMASIGAAKASNPQKVFSAKIIFFTNSRKFSLSRYMVYSLVSRHILISTCQLTEDLGMKLSKDVLTYWFYLG